MEDSNLRQLWQLTNLRLKTKRYERQMEALTKTAVLHDVLEKKGVGCGAYRKSQITQ
jgi:hypothetical protein